MAAHNLELRSENIAVMFGCKEGPLLSHQQPAVSPPEAAQLMLSYRDERLIRGAVGVQWVGL